MGALYLLAGKFSYIVLNKAVYEKVVAVSTKRRQCRNNSDIACYISGEYIMEKYQFNGIDFTKRAYEAYFGMKLRDQGKSCHPTRCANMTAAASLLSAKLKPFSQLQLNDLVCDLGLSEESLEILASRLGEHVILDSGTKITFYRDRDDLLIRFSTMEDDFVY